MNNDVDIFLMSSLLALYIFHAFFMCFFGLIDFEQVNICWRGIIETFIILLEMLQIGMEKFWKWDFP